MRYLHQSFNRTLDYILLALMFFFFASCDSNKAEKNEAKAGSATQNDANINTDTSYNIPLYTLYIRKDEFVQKLIFSGSGENRTRRLVLKFQLILDSSVRKLTMGIWAGRNKHNYFSQNPGLILKPKNKADTTVPKDLFLGDLQVRRGDIMNYIKDCKQTYLVFQPTIITKGNHSYLSYKMYCSQSLDKSDWTNLVPYTFDDPSPPANAAADQE